MLYIHESFFLLFVTLIAVRYQSVTKMNSKQPSVLLGFVWFLGLVREERGKYCLINKESDEENMKEKRISLEVY